MRKRFIAIAIGATWFATLINIVDWILGTDQRITSI